MQAIISPGRLSGSINIPPSKSMMQRVCACALLHKGKTIITNPGTSNDDNVALNIIQQLGATVRFAGDNTIEISGAGNTPKDIIDCGESGLSARLFLPIAAIQQQTVTITGSGSLLQRPMTEHIQALPQLGVTIQSQNECLPITAQGPLTPADITVDGSMSSQFLSGLLITYAFAATKEVTITVNNLKSKPYIDLTLQVLQQFGKKITNDNYKSFTIIPSAIYNDVHINIEADWSAAANFIVAKAMGADIEINNLNTTSLQADKAITKVVTPTNDAFDFDATDCPDLFPILSIYAAKCHGESSITGLHRLMHKESNRAETIMAMLDELGVNYYIEDDALIIHGNATFKSCTINSFNDHRIVMAAAIAGIFAEGAITILQAEAVNKSYPAFFETLKAAGVNCQLVN